QRRANAGWLIATGRPFPARAMALETIRDVEVRAALDGELLLLGKLFVASVRLPGDVHRQHRGKCHEPDDHHCRELLYSSHSSSLLILLRDRQGVPRNR